MKRNDIKIAGSGVVNGGVYREVKISGSGKILDNVEAEEIKIAGALKSLGTLSAKLIKIAGSCKVEKDIKGEEIKIAGSAKVEGNVEGEIIKIAGMINCKGDINGEEIDIDAQNSELKNIFGENVFVGIKEMKSFWFRKHLQNHIETIEATNIELNNCKVTKVSGKNIIIGKRCTIDVVEYQDSIEIDKSAKVKETIKI